MTGPNSDTVTCNQCGTSYPNVHPATLSTADDAGIGPMCDGCCEPHPLITHYRNYRPDLPVASPTTYDLYGWIIIFSITGIVAITAAVIELSAGMHGAWSYVSIYALSTGGMVTSYFIGRSR